MNRPTERRQPALAEEGREPGLTRRVRALRGPKAVVDPWRPIAVLDETERTEEGSPARAVTILLAGAECPFTCRFCDLWRYTLDRPTPEGALVAQVEAALASIPPPGAGCRLKLYNASNFFDERAVPAVDLPRLAELGAPFERVVVECHPRLVGAAAVDFAARLPGRLEVAMGLETVHPGVLPRLNKGMALADFDRAAAFLASHGLPLRVFVLVGLPWLAAREAVDWAVVSAAYALERGAATVSLVPLRGGNGELDRLAVEGDFAELSLAEIERAFERALKLPAAAERAVLLDLWDLDRFAACDSCSADRRQRLERMNLSGRIPATVSCEDCENA